MKNYDQDEHYQDLQINESFDEDTEIMEIEKPKGLRLFAGIILLGFVAFLIASIFI